MPNASKGFLFLVPVFFVKKHFKKVGLDFFYWTKQNKDVECCFKIVFIQMFNWKWFYFQKEKSRVQLILFHSKGFFFPNQKSLLAKKKRGRGRERERGKRTSAVNKHSVAATRQLFTLFIEDSSETKKVLWFNIHAVLGLRVWKQCEGIWPELYTPLKNRLFFFITLTYIWNMQWKNKHHLRLNKAPEK